jgi:zinc metalloprotease ZmpA
MKRLIIPAFVASLTTASLTSVGNSPATASADREGTAVAQATADAVARAKIHAVAHPASTSVGKGQDLSSFDTILDKSGASHVRFERTYRGLPVIGGDFVVHQTKSGVYSSTSGSKVGRMPTSIKPSVSAKSAAAKAGETVRFAKSQATPELVVLARQKAASALTWRVNVTGRNKDGSPAGEYVFIDARGARVVDSWPSVLAEAGTGEGQLSGSVELDTTSGTGGFELVDPERGDNITYNGPQGSEVFSDEDNAWGDGTQEDPATAGADAHYGIAKTWDFYLKILKRNGIGDDGKGAASHVHDGDYVNASWDDACFCMSYGDGDGSTILPLVSLDVAGHEMSHGVTSRTANLIYQGQSGGLNEATSDIFGTMVEFYAKNDADPGDYVIGEQIFVDNDPATNYIRRMDQPSADGVSLDCFKRGAGRTDVHFSSGIANHFFYLLAEGSGPKEINGIQHNSKTCDKSTVTGIGRRPAGKIWYAALTKYMTSTTTFRQARVATIKAATDLFGADSAKTEAVAAAWTAVKVKSKK